jgi:hypothetical protein
MSGNNTFFTEIGDQVFPFVAPQPLESAPGAIDNMVIGAGTKQAGTFTTLTADTIAGAGITGSFASPPPLGSTAPNAVTSTTLQVDTGTKTAAATSGAATLNKNAGVITSEALTTAAGAQYTLTLTNSDIAAADQVMASVQLGSATTGTPTITTVTPGAGSVVIVVQNIHATAALNGTIKIAFVRFKN